MADSVVPTTSGDASDVPEFTAALSEHSDEEMDELQFGNVDLTSNADAELVADSKAAVAKPDVWADAKPEVGSQALSLQDWISTSSKAHALTAQGQIQEWRASAGVTEAELTQYLTQYHRCSLSRLPKINTNFLQHLAAKGALQPQARSPVKKYRLAIGAQAPADAEIEKITVWLKSLPKKDKHHPPKQHWQVLAADKLVVYSISQLQGLEGASAIGLKQQLAVVLAGNPPKLTGRMKKQYVPLARDVIDTLLKSGAVQQYTPAGAITDQSTKKKKAKHANRTSPLLRLRNAAPVNPEQVQQAFEFLGLPKPAPLAEANAGEARADGHTGLVASTGTAGSAEDHAVAGNSTSAAGREATDTAAPGPDTAMAEAALNSQAAAIRPGAAASVIMTPEAAAAVAEPAGATAVTDASPPAYAVQMDGPNDILHAKPQIQQQTEPQTGGISAGSVPGDDYLESVSRLKVPAEAALLSASQQAPPAITPPTAVESLLVAGADASTGDLSEKHRQVHNGSGNGFQLASVGQDKLNGQATTYTAGKRGPLDGDSIPAEPKKQKVLQDDAPVQSPPAHGTWLQQYLATHPDCRHPREVGDVLHSWHDAQDRSARALHAQGFPGDPAQGISGHPAEGNLALPPALACLDPSTGQWVPTAQQANPFVIAQMQQPRPPTMSTHQSAAMEGAHTPGLFTADLQADDARQMPAWHEHHSRWEQPQQEPWGMQGHPHSHMQPPQRHMQPHQGHTHQPQHSLRQPQGFLTHSAESYMHEPDLVEPAHWSQGMQQPPCDKLQPGQGMIHQPHGRAIWPHGNPQHLQGMPVSQMHLHPLPPDMLQHHSMQSNDGGVTDHRPGQGSLHPIRADHSATASFEAGQRAFPGPGPSGWAGKRPLEDNMLLGGMRKRVHQAGKSRLHHELTEFAVLAAPTEEERATVRHAVESLSRVAQLLWPHSRTVLFGSQATDLALPGSDLDIVILGVAQDLTTAATGFTRNQRELLMDLLEDLLQGLQTADMVKGKSRLVDAKVPIIKCNLKFGGGLAADISLGAINGAAAVPYVHSMIQAAPPLKCLVLFIKALLKEAALNEVFTGGLSSYSIVNMVMAHLQSVGYPLPTLPDVSTPAEPMTHPSAAHQAHAAAAQLDGVSACEDDVGELLLGFLQCFGSQFDYSQQAVSVREGGFVRKLQEWKQPGKAFLLSVEDAQQPGKDIGSGTFNIRMVQQLLAACLSTLHQCQAKQAQHADPAQREADAWAAVQADGASRSAAVWGSKAGHDFPLLSELIVVDMAIGRTNAAAKMRRQQAKQPQHSHARAVPVLACHALLKSHLQRMPGLESSRPTFPVGKAAKKGSLQIQMGSRQQRKKARRGQEKDGSGRPHTRSQGTGGFNNAPYILETGPSQEPQMKKSRTMGKHAVANAAKRAKGNTAASDADSAPTKKRKNKNTANNALGVQQGAIQKPTRGQRRKLAKSRRAAA